MVDRTLEKVVGDRHKKRLGSTTKSIIEKEISLPGGIYNFGCSNNLNSYGLHLKAANLLGLKEPEKWIITDEERFHDEPRNLTMDCSLINEYGIYFPESIEGIEEAIKRPFRT